jgi:hypothetical protein
VKAKATKESVAMSDEAITLRILSHLDNLDDLHAAAMIDKGFYGAYKKHELFLMKNILKAGRRTRSYSHDIPRARNSLGRGLNNAPSSISVALSRGFDDSKYRALDDIKSTSLTSIDPSDEDTYNASPPFSPYSEDEPLSREDADRILWPDDLKTSHNNTKTRGSRSGSLWKRQQELRLNDVERNEKYLVRDVVYIEDKALVTDNNKHLRDDLDRRLGLSMKSCGSASS